MLFIPLVHWGKPKGVMLEHRALVNRLYWMRERFSSYGERILQSTSINFDVSSVEMLFFLLKYKHHYHLSKSLSF